MPANYGPENLSRDVFAVKEWIEIASDLKGFKNKWFGEVKLYQEISGNEGVLVSSTSAVMKYDDLEVELCRS